MKERRIGRDRKEGLVFAGRKDWGRQKEMIGIGRKERLAEAGRNY
jgi:hypothetical protein